MALDRHWCLAAVLFTASCGAKTSSLGQSGFEHDGASSADAFSPPDSPIPSDAPFCGSPYGDWCNAAGRRVTCGADGGWHETDYVCTINVAVDDETGSYCATKADGRYKCWGSLPADPLPEAKYVRVQLAREGLVGLTDDGHVFTVGFDVPADLPLAAGLRATNMFGYQALCFRSLADDSFVMYLDIPLGPRVSVLDPGPFSDVTCAYEGHACGAKKDGSIWCDHMDTSMLANQFWSQVALSRNFLCAYGKSRVACAPGYSNRDPAPVFAPYEYDQTAVTDGVVCAMTWRKDIGCLRADWTDISVEGGHYRFMDGGRNVLCAIRQNGTTVCWQHEDAAPADVHRFMPVSPPIDPDW